MKSLTYVEVDIPFCDLIFGVAPCTASLTSSPPTGTIKCFNCRSTCQDIANFTPSDVTLRFAKDTSYLPRDIDAIPSVLDVSFSPGTISLGENLGTRATLTVTFKDHRHSDTGEGYDKYLSDRTYDPFQQGTFWGKFRARQPFLRGRYVRWITGLLGQSLAEMRTRHFVVDSFDGPSPDGKYVLVAKDVLKLADGDRAQAPAMNNGFLSAAITTSSPTATLLPSGIGDEEYPLIGSVIIAGREGVDFTRVGDTLTLTGRAQFGTTAQAHNAQDRVQVVLAYADDPAVIIEHLLTNYAGIPSSFIDLDEWTTETADYLGLIYNARICEPTSVATLVSELIQQACLSLWWDDEAQQIRLKVLRGLLSGAATFTPENTIAGSLTVKEQPEKRLSQVWVYFGKINQLRPLSDVDNFRSTAVIIDEEAEDDYGSASIKKIFSRWIPALGRTVADRLGIIHLGRFRDPPRRFTFDLMRYADTDVSLGSGYRVESSSLQDETGASVQVPVQVTRLNSPPDRYQIEAEEILYDVPEEDLSQRLVIVDANINNVNFREAHDSIYPTAVSGDAVTLRINDGVIVGSTSTLNPALDVGSWPAGIILNLDVRGRVEGCGGAGAPGGGGSAGLPGGLALYTRYATRLFISTGEIFSGGGGGGGGKGGGGLGGAGGGGGGAGQLGGNPGVGGQATAPMGDGSPGVIGTSDAGGAGGAPYAIPPPYERGGYGGNGGGPGLAGAAGGTTSAGPGSAGGAAGNSIDGVSYITMIEGPGDIRGSQIN